MRKKAIVLYEDGVHRCLMFDALVSGDGVQSNQFLIEHGTFTAILDPGGDLTYTPLSMELSRHIDVKNLSYVLASHQDPDIISSLDKWLLHTHCQVVVSRLWERFLPHLMASYLTLYQGITASDRIIALPDRGADIPFGDTVIKAIPAHFLHSVGNFHFYDPVSRILFSGDVGASMVPEAQAVSDFSRHTVQMEGFHRRYMGGNKVCRLWANMVRRLNPDKIVPQHGAWFEGENVGRFLDWIENLECGIDLLNQADYSIP